MASRLPVRQKRLYVRSSIPSHSKRAASALYEIQLQRQECSVASRLPVRQKRLYVRSSIPSHSKRAASALYEIQLQRQECSVASRLPVRQKRLYVRALSSRILNEPLPLYMKSSSSGKNVRWLRAFLRGKSASTSELHPLTF